MTDLSPQAAADAMAALDELRRRLARLVLASHLGRPDNGRDPG